MDLVTGNLGPETTYDVKITGGNLAVSVVYQGKQATATLSGSVSGSQLLMAEAESVSNATAKAILTALSGVISAIG